MTRIILNHTEESAGSFRNTDYKDFMDRALTRMTTVGKFTEKGAV